MMLQIQQFVNTRVDTRLFFLNVGMHRVHSTNYIHMYQIKAEKMSFYFWLALSVLVLLTARLMLIFFSGREIEELKFEIFKFKIHRK